MKIAVIAPTSIPARRANTIQVMKMTQALVVLGHEVRLAAPRRFDAPAQPLPGTLTIPYPDYAASHRASWDEIAHHYGLRHPFDIHWLPSRLALRSYDFSLHAVRWARQWHADLIYTRLPQAAAFASLSGLATILETHDLPQGTAGPWLFRAFIKGRGARRLVVITQALANDLQQRFSIPVSRDRRQALKDGHKVHLIVIAPDGVDLERYEGLPGPSGAA